MASRKRQAADTLAGPSKKRQQQAPNGRPTKKAAQQTGASVATQLPKLSPPTEKLSVFVFGDGSSGELGLGSKVVELSVPRRNDKLEGVVSLAAGGMHAAALTADNRLLTWGVNDQCTLGRDTAWEGGLRDIDDEGSDADSEAELNPLESTPTAVPAGALPADFKIVQIAAGDSTTFVLGQDGSVYGWGTFRDSSGIYGFTLNPKTGAIVEVQKTPYRIPELRNIVSLSAGTDFALALDASGTVFAWGTGQQNQLGRRLNERHRSRALLPSRVEVPKTCKIASIHAGSDHAFAIDSQGDTWAWGLNNFAQTGMTDNAGTDGATTIAPRKVPALVGKKMKVLAGGRHHSLGVTQDGHCLVWGRMDGCQLGLDVASLPTGDSTKVLLDERGRPRALLEPSALPIDNCVYAAAGSDHSFVITAEGKAYSWGFNVNSQCGQGSSDDIAVAKLMNAKAIRETKLTWAGAGGQYSMLAAPEGASAPMPNGAP